MNINSKNIFIIYLLLYFSLLLGLYFNENFSGGYIQDYNVHKHIASYFSENFFETFLNYEELRLPHSPIFMSLFFILQKISFSETFAKLINLHFSLLIPFFFYLCLKIKYKFKISDIKILLPSIIFFSPYFRSGSIWIADENISLVFLSICFYFFLKFEDSKNLNFSPKLLFCIFINILFSFPAIYYILALNVNQWFIPWLFRSNFINFFSIIITILFFYSIPFLLINIKQNFPIRKFKVKNLVLSIIFLFLLIFYLDYHWYGGGIFFKLSNLIFGNNYLFYVFSLISLNVFILIFFDSNKNKNKIFDLVLLLTLFLLEVDGVFYHETYDPLLYFIFFLLIKNKIYLNFVNKLTNKKFILLALFSSSFYVLSILKTII